jgi:hypothetical protein
MYCRTTESSSLKILFSLPSTAIFFFFLDTFHLHSATETSSPGVVLVSIFVSHLSSGFASPD